MNTRGRQLSYALLCLCLGPAAAHASPDPAVSVPARAAYYGEGYRGRPMADRGRPFNPEALTCASWFYPFGTVLEVTCGPRCVQVVVTDRGPARWVLAEGVLIDLSLHAFVLISPDRLHPLRPGRIPVTIRRVAIKP